jgi:predicted short-subunit dehydrogenase-like oxidoreductase (DUF2520 family)
VLTGPIGVVGAGRLGPVLVRALAAAGLDVTGPHGRGYDGRESDGRAATIVLLCVPDDAIRAASQAVLPGPLVGHLSGASDLSVLAPHRGFSLHPLMTITAGQPTDPVLKGVHAAVSGADPAALAVAESLASSLGMQPFAVADRDRVAYHAAAAMASNFLVTVESAAARLMESAGLDRRLLLPLARESLENWGALGPAALTGPVARGDRGTVAAHRVAVRDRTPDLLPLFDALVAATNALVATGRRADTDFGEDLA